MAARWVGLTRPHKKKKTGRWGFRQALKECAHALGACGALVMAAAMNFAMYPDALAAVVEQGVLVSFDSTEASATPAQETAPVAVNEDDLRLLAATVFGEARSEGELGMRAVAHVMVNRVGERFGEDLATVILTPRQFSVWNRGDPNRRLVQTLVREPDRYAADEAQWEQAQRIAREVLSGRSVDPTEGALFYHTQAVRPRWAPYGRDRQVIGEHVFYSDVPESGQRRTPRVTNVAQIIGQPMTADAPSTARTGPRAGRVNGVIQYAPASAARAPLPSEQSGPNVAAAPTRDSVPIASTAHGAGAMD